MTEPLVIQPQMMKSSGDCAIACLTMLCGKTYAEVLAAVPKYLRGHCTTDGLTTKQVIAVAKRLGCQLEYHDEPEEDAIGIIDLDREENGHMAMYLKGVVYNPADGDIYTDLDAYMTRGKWTLEGFLWRVK